MPHFKDVQRQLAAHLRDPENNPPPEGLADERLNVYRSLFFNNISSFISNGFPVLKKFYDKDAWQQLVRNFYACHQSHSPYFSEVSQEFVQFLADEYQPTPADPPFIAELAHYERAEIALSIADVSVDWESIERAADFIDKSPVPSPLAWRFKYHWEVHRISPDYRPSEPLEQAIYIILCRNRANKINFIRANEVTHRLLKNLEEHPDRTGGENISATIQELHLPQTDATVQGALQTLNKLFEQEVILGVRR